MQKIVFIFIFILGSIYLVSQDELLPIVIDDKLGWININGSIVIEPEFENDYIKKIITIGGNKYLIYDFEHNTRFSEGLAFAQKNKYFLKIFVYGKDLGYINEKGEYQITGLRDWAGQFSNGLAPYIMKDLYFNSEENPKYSYMTKQGKRAFQRNFILALPFQDRRALVIENQDYEYIDLSGKTIASSPYYESARSFSEGLAAIRIEGKWGFIDTNGILVIKPQFLAAEKFNNGICKVMDDTKLWSFIDKDGNPISNKKFLNATDFNNGYAAVSLKENDLEYWYFIDKKGKRAFNQNYDYAGTFSEGMAFVKDQQKFGFINSKGELVIEFDYDFVLSFRNGAALVFDENGKHYINKSGDIIFTFEEDLDAELETKLD